MKILCIDDELSTVKVLSKIFKIKGYEFSFTHDGREGLRSIRTTNADVILLDIGIPYFNGLQIIDELVKDGTIHNHNIIVLTASAMGDNEFEKLIKKGVKKCLRKPYQLEILLSSIEEFQHS